METSLSTLQMEAAFLIGYTVSNYTTPDSMALTFKVVADFGPSIEHPSLRTTLFWLSANFYFPFSLNHPSINSPRTPHDTARRKAVTWLKILH
jgi:hypothetical protein